MTLAFARSEAEVFVPDGGSAAEALARVTHLGVAAHADDLEIMAYHGICHGLTRENAHFGGVVCTDGRGAPRTGSFADMTDDEMQQVRRGEQREAARRGRYAAVVQLDHPSESVKRGVTADVVADLAMLLRESRPEVVYTHNPMDAHITHLGVCAAVVDAVRSLAAEDRPETVLGCEGWRSLDWLDDADKIRLDLGANEHGWSDLIGAFASQVEGGRPYDAGAIGRARANAVFDGSREPAPDERLWLAVDLTPLTRVGGGDLETFVRDRLTRFEKNLLGALARVRA